MSKLPRTNKTLFLLLSFSDFCAFFFSSSAIPTGGFLQFRPVSPIFSLAVINMLLFSVCSWFFLTKFLVSVIKAFVTEFELLIKAS
ncbi:hypothetical protein CSW10_02655 [Mesomycoplasma dispar]|uniref:Uncharacterized protein n=1 Tax=Mesomycoplasma dispar TaxID=86660 RepID=A0ABN5DW60_9BACT|nr:hypothetical protein CSW10_02655 [Mesomycoplasma dispar]